MMFGGSINRTSWTVVEVGLGLLRELAVPHWLALLLTWADLAEAWLSWLGGATTDDSRLLS